MGTTRVGISYEKLYGTWKPAIVKGPDFATVKSAIAA